MRLDALAGCCLTSASLHVEWDCAWCGVVGVERFGGGVECAGAWIACYAGWGGGHQAIAGCCSGGMVPFGRWVGVNGNNGDFHAVFRGFCGYCGDSPATRGGSPGSCGGVCG